MEADEMVPDNKISVLRLKETNSDTSRNIEFEEIRKVWAEIELLDKQNIFSKNGVAIAGATLKVHRIGDLTLHDALLWKGKHCAITEANQKTPAQAEITVALIEPVECICKKRTFETGKTDGYNRPIMQKGECIKFPAYLIEKYVGFQKTEVAAQTEVRLIMVTPKQILLETGEAVQVDGKSFYIEVTHAMGTYKNEYEVVCRGDI